MSKNREEEIKYMDNFKIILEAMIDNSSLTNVQKQLAKERLKVSADIDFSNFVSEKQKIQQLAIEINKILGDSLKPKEALSWANQYWKQMQSGARQAQREQDKLNQAQKKSSLATQEKYYQRIINNNKTIYSLKEKLLRADEKQSQEIQNQITKLEKRNQYNYSQLSKKGLIDNSWEFEVNSSREVLGNRFRINQEKQRDIALSKRIAEVNKIQHLSDTGSFAKQVSDATVEYNKLSTVTDDLKTDFAELQRLQTVLGTSQTDEELISNYEKFDTTLKKVKNTMSILRNEQNSLGINSEMNASLKSINTLANAMASFRDNNTKMTKDMKSRLDIMYNSLTNGARLSKREVDELRASFSQLKLDVRDAGKLGKSPFHSVIEGMKSFSTWLPASQLIMSGVNSIRNMAKEVINLDTALVDLKKTTDATASQLEDFYYASNNTAKRLGVTTEEIINATSAWSRLGYAIKDASTMAENSAILASISPEMNIDTATDGLVSTLKAFKIEAEDSLDGVISKINIIGNTQAVDNNDVVDILTRSSSAMAEANNTLEETIALGVAATEITRDADAVGTMLKTVSMRIRGYDEELESYTDDLANLSGTIADLTKTASSPRGISLFTDDTMTTYKSTYQILKDISEIYDELDDKTQAKLLEALAGKRQGQAVAAIINNFENAEKSMNSMANSAGNAMEEMEVIYDSLDYKLNKLGETGTGIAQNLFNREDMKTVVDGLTWVGEKIDWLTDKLGLFGTIGLGAGLFAGFKNVGEGKMLPSNCFE